MRFTLIKDLKQDKMMKPILSGLLIFTILFLLADMLTKHYTFGILAPDIHFTLYGNEEEYLDPISKASFLEYWHIEIFFIMLVLLSLSAVFIRLCQNNIKNMIILNTVLIAALSSLIFLVLAYFVSDIFIYAYSISLILWHVLALYMAFFSLWNLLRV